jgi:hypothetical protein
MRTYLVLIPLCAFLLSCQPDGNSPAPGPDTGALGDVATVNPWATTSKDNYKQGEEVSVTIGTTTQPISVLTCCSNTPVYYIDKFEGGKWVEYLAYEIDCMKLCAQYGVSVSPSQPLHAAIDPQISESGEYRFRFLFADGMVSDKQLISSSFHVE